MLGLLIGCLFATQTTHAWYISTVHIPTEDFFGAVDVALIYASDCSEFQQSNFSLENYSTIPVGVLLEPIFVYRNLEGELLVRNTNTIFLEEILLNEISIMSLNEPVYLEPGENITGSCRAVGVEPLIDGNSFHILWRAYAFPSEEGEKSKGGISL